jgi:hypothetical protein
VEKEKRVSVEKIRRKNEICGDNMEKKYLVTILF